MKVGIGNISKQLIRMYHCTKSEERFASPVTLNTRVKSAPAPLAKPRADGVHVQINLDTTNRIQ